MINPILEKFRDWHHQRKLKRLGFTELAYRRYTDPDVNKFANSITEYYRGYPRVVEFTSTRVAPFTLFNSWTDAYEGLQQWCADNCVGKWRDDIHRVVKQTGLDIDRKEHPEWFFNDVGGGDVLFFAFQDERDAMLFALKWL